ncbi:MAG: hypothetical protein WC003_14880 [Terrimicrobiaceae bacterium]
MLSPVAVDACADGAFGGGDADSSGACRVAAPKAARNTVTLRTWPTVSTTCFSSKKIQSPSRHVWLTSAVRTPEKLTQIACLHGKIR